MSRQRLLRVALGAALAAAPVPALGLVLAAAPAPATAARATPSPTGRPVIGGEALGTAGETLPVDAPPLPAAVTTILTAKSWVVADLDTGAVLAGRAPHAVGAPASVQKLLLASALLPKLDPAQDVEVTRADLDFEPGSSAVGLILGGHYPVQTLWLGLLLNSGNDAANTLARIGGGTAGVPGAIVAMNEQAHRLGAYDTHAVTPSGLDAAGQQTSAYDLALIARDDFAREDFRRYVATERAQMPPEPPTDPRGFQIQNDNQLLYGYPGALGGKTGFTDEARHTYMGAAQRDGRRLVVTLMGAESVPRRTWQQAAALLDWGFTVAPGASVGRLVDPGEADRLLIPTPGGAPAGPVPPANPPWRLATVVLAGLAAGALGASLVRRWRRRRGAAREPTPG